MLPLVPLVGDGEQVPSLNSFLPLQTNQMQTGLMAYIDSDNQLVDRCCAHCRCLLPQKMQPIYVQDVAQGIINAMVNSDAPGKTYTLGGPDVYTKREIVSFVSDKINRFVASRHRITTTNNHHTPTQL